MSDRPDIPSIVEQAVQRPARTDMDGLSISERPLRDLIEADRYLRGIDARRRSRPGIRMFVVRDPGMGQLNANLGASSS